MDSNHDNQLQRLVSYQLDDPGNDEAIPLGRMNLPPQQAIATYRSNF